MGCILFKHIIKCKSPTRPCCPCIRCCWASSELKNTTSMLFIDRVYKHQRWFISQRWSKSRLFITFRGFKIKRIKKYTQKVVFRVVYHRKKNNVHISTNIGNHRCSAKKCKNISFIMKRDLRISKAHDISWKILILWDVTNTILTKSQIHFEILWDSSPRCTH